MVPNAVVQHVHVPLASELVDSRTIPVEEKLIYFKKLQGKGPTNSLKINATSPSIGCKMN